MVQQTKLLKMEVLQIFKETIGASMCLTLTSLHIELEHTFSNGEHKIWFETTSRSAYLHFNPHNIKASYYGRNWMETKEVMNRKIFNDLNK